MAKFDAAIAVTTLSVALIFRPVKAFDQLLTPDNGGDVNVDGSLVHPTSWAIECDPWRERPIDVELDYLKINGTFLDDYDDWECPEEMRSISGCGDFLTDTRGIMCDEPKSFKRCSDQRVVNVPQPYVSQYHVCFQHPVGEYANYGTVDGLVTPPMIGRHRPRWAKWGEYEVSKKRAKRIRIFDSTHIFVGTFYFSICHPNVGCTMPSMVQPFFSTIHAFRKKICANCDNTSGIVQTIHSMEKMLTIPTVQLLASFVGF